jgi:DNA primase
MNKYAVFAETIKNVVSPQEAAELYGIEFNRAGFAICPLHSEKTASFKIHGDSFHCFGCDWHGDVIDLVRELFGLSFQSTIKKINDDFSVGLPTNRKLTLRERRDIQRRQRKIVAERKKREISDFLYELRYDSLWTEWFLLDQIKTMYAPKPDDDEWPPEFCKVLNEMPYLEYQIDCLL